MAKNKDRDDKPDTKRERRRQRRRRDRRLGNMTAEERRERLRQIGKAEREGDITKKQERRRRKRVRESGHVMTQKAWRNDTEKERHYSTLSPKERRRRIQEIKSNPNLSEGQLARRIQNVRAGGPIGRRPSRPTEVGTGDELAPEHLDAYTILKAKFRDYGLGSLAPLIRDMLIDGRSAAEIEIELQESEEWKRRFKGNEIRRQKGLNVLTVSEYLATENQYSQIFKNYGLPAGFYDDPDDFADFIGKSIAPAEMEQRVGAWSDLARREDPAVKRELRRRGIGDGELLAWMIDPDRAAPIVQRAYQSTLIGAAARRTGISADTDYADKLAGMGVTEQQATQVYGQIADALPTLENLGEIYGTDISQSDLEEELFEGDAESGRKRKRLASRERAAFSGSSGVGRGSLGRGTAGDY